jgi:SecD/SecF fusion protein
LRSKSYLFLLLVLGLGLLSGYLYSIRAYKYGLDVKGGVRFTYQMDLSKLKPDQRSNLSEIRGRIQRILESRTTGSFGVAEPLVAPKGEDQFIIELPGFTDKARAAEVIGSSASIEFYYASTLPSQGRAYGLYEPVDETDPKTGNPVISFRRANAPADAPLIKPGTPEYLQVIQSWGEPIIKGDDLKSAQPEVSGEGYRPLMTFSPAGAQKMERWSRQHQTDGANIAAVLDNKVLSVAALQNNTVLRDNAVITGTFTTQYVKNLTELLNSGALPVDLKMLSSEQVDPTIGAQALDRMVTAGMVAFGLISAFLIVYYAFPGVVALVALLLYVLFTLTVLKLIGATFSLAAIAGFILSVGMAVDANILVFERFKEEMKSGRSLQTAIELGFRRALPAIVDSNACTILTSLVLVNLGTGPVRGFATTLIIGVAISLFTAVFITRSLLVFLVGSGLGTNPKMYALERNWFGEKFETTADQKPIQIVNNSRKWFVISAASIIIGLPFIFLGGLKPNVEFQGGYEAQFATAGKNLTPAQITASLERAGFKGANVKMGGEGAQRVAIATVPAEGPLKGLPDQEAFQRITQAAGFQAGDLKGSSTIGPAIRGETIQNAILGVVLSAALIIIYLALRFGIAVGGFSVGLRFGFSAIGALVHDVLFVLGVSAVVGYFFGWEISALFITSMLTVIGFSVHDTIVIFDRIRENLHRPLKGEDFANLVNRSVTQSFARSLNTSMTVIATLIILLVMGTTTPDLKLFCATMLAGIVSGTYSSIYNAAPILYLWDRAVGKKRGESHTIVGHAQEQVNRDRVITTRTAEEVASTTVGASGRTYGQVRRRANSPVRQAEREIEDL